MDTKNLERSSMPLAKLPSLGTTSAELLSQVGITDLKTLQEHGSAESFRALRMRFGKRITVNWIYALESALLGLDFQSLGKEQKLKLKDSARGVIHELALKE